MGRPRLPPMAPYSRLTAVRETGHFYLSEKQPFPLRVDMFAGRWGPENAGYVDECGVWVVLHVLLLRQLQWRCSAGLAPNSARVR